MSRNGIVILVVLTAVFAGCGTEVTAQTCETRPLAFDVDQPGQLEPSDCRVAGASCSDCFTAPGEFWTIDARAGELILLTVWSSELSMVLRLYDSAGRRLYDFHESCLNPSVMQSTWSSGYVSCVGHSFTANVDGTYRAEVAEEGYMIPRFGNYVVRAQRVTTPLPRPAVPWPFGDRVRFVWSRALSLTPVLEYAMTVRRDTQSFFVSLGDGGSPNCNPCERSFEGVPSGTYHYRFLARNELGWGPPGPEGSVTVTNGPHLWASFIGFRNVTLSWSAPSLGPPQSFQLLVGASPGSTSLGVYDVGSSPDLKVFDETWQLYVANVPPGIYYVRVRAITAVGVTEPSNEVIVRVY